MNSDVSAIAGSPAYQCYLNSETYLSSGGSQQLPAVAGAGKGQNAGDHPTANSAFVASYLDTEIGHQIVLQVADARQVTVTAQQVADARATLSQQISSVMSEILQTAEGQNPRYSCSVTGQPLTGPEVLATMPSSFVDSEVQFDATAGALEEDLAGVGSSPSALEGYYACTSRPVRHGMLRRRGVLERERSARLPRPRWRSGRPSPGGVERHEQRDDPVQRVDRRRRGAGGARERA